MPFTTNGERHFCVFAKTGQAQKMLMSPLFRELRSHSAPLSMPGGLNGGIIVNPVQIASVLRNVLYKISICIIFAAKLRLRHSI